jgi:hypothetical protein
MTDSSQWAFNKTFDWLNINEGWFGLGICALVFLIIFLLAARSFKSYDLENTERERDEERENVRLLRKTLNTILYLDPTLGEAFPPEEKLTWAQRDREDIIKVKRPSIDVGRLADLWDDIDKVQVNDLRRADLKQAQKALKEARRG